MKIAVLGVGKIGKYHVREYKNAECEVAAILGSTEDSSKKAAEMLKSQFGISAKPYYDIDALLQNEKLDAVSICTPPRFHYLHAKKCLEAGLHVMCEKPFVLDDITGNYGKALELINLASSKKRIITANTQWVSALKFIPQEIINKTISNFSVHMHPAGFNGVDLLTECLPHFNSILISLFKKGEIKNIKFPVKSKDEILINFDCINGNEICKVSYELKNRTEKPSNFGFSINENKFTRKVGENYSQSLKKASGEEYKIEDPLKMSIKKFIEAVEKSKEEMALVLPEEILQNVKMQDLIVEKYLSNDNNH